MKNKLNKNSLFQKQLKNFKSIKRGYYSFLILLFIYVLSFFNALLVNKNALVVKYNDHFFFPAFRDLMAQFITQPMYEAKYFKQDTLFGEPCFGEPNYRELKKRFRQAKTGNFVILPLYPYSPNEILLNEMSSNPPLAPSSKHILGIDNQGRDIFARLIYGFRISISFALIITFFSYCIGIIAGAVLGFIGGKVDLLGLRIIEIISAIPFLFMTMILVSIVKPSFVLLASLLIILGGWIGITYYIRGEFLKEKNKEYVLSAISLGASNFRVMFKHILPNSLTPVITFAPFSIVGYISILVSLDFLGLGLMPPTPSWGELLNQGVADIKNWWLVLFPLLAIFLTLLLIIFIGESIREAFDPKSYSRLK